MTPQKQTKLYSKDGGHNGNCFAACIASLMDIPLWMVPPFEEAFGRNEWYEDRANEWFKRMFNLKMVKYEGHKLELLPEFYVASGKSPRGVQHATIWSNGVMVHDPHFSDGGILSVDRTWHLEKIGD
jgi:hypothetical protein